MLCQLSYGSVREEGFEPPISCTQSTRHTILAYSRSCARWGSNPQLRGLKPRASAGWATSAQYSGRDSNPQHPGPEPGASAVGLPERSTAGGSRTHNEPVLSRLPLPLGYRGVLFIFECQREGYSTGLEPAYSCTTNTRLDHFGLEHRKQKPPTPFGAGGLSVAQSLGRYIRRKPPRPRFFGRRCKG